MPELGPYTASIRSEFIRATNAIPKRALMYKPFTTEMSSTARVENHAWVTPSPGVSEYQGFRRETQVSYIPYQIANREFDATFTVGQRDWEDDKIGGFKIKAAELAQKMNFYPMIGCLKALANGYLSTSLCFDGTPFFSTTHNQGTYPTSSVYSSGFTGGGNLIGYTSTGSTDGRLHRAVFLVHDDGQMIKPIILQRRKGPTLNNDVGTKEALYRKQVRFWADMELGFGYGFPWDAVMVNITNTPTVPDVYAILDQVITLFRKFQMPRSLPTDSIMYPHTGFTFSASTATAVVSSGIERVFANALNNDRVGVSVAGSTSGIVSADTYKGSFDLIQSQYLDPQ